jgi:putative methionine-R-sulfoxide reductase with GAF domain
VKGVLDIDSDEYSTFDDIDRDQLQQVIDLIAKWYNNCISPLLTNVC